MLTPMSCYQIIFAKSVILLTLLSFLMGDSICIPHGWFDSKDHIICIVDCFSFLIFEDDS